MTKTITKHFSHYVIGASFDSSISISFILYNFDMFILSIWVHREKIARSWHLNWPRERKEFRDSGKAQREREGACEYAGVCIFDPGA